MSPVRVRVRTAGSCVHPEHVVLRTLSRRILRFPAMFLIIEHPREGLVLYDTGYSQDFFEATAGCPEKLYAWVTPVSLTPGRSAVAQLRALGYSAQDVRSVLISHFHADHIAALRDFPRARFRCFAAAAADLRRHSRLSALSKGILPRLLPPDFESRLDVIDALPLRPLPVDLAPFEQGVDVFGDGSVLAVHLEGHAPGQLGLFVHADDGLRYLFVADACWVRASFEKPVLPLPITSLLFDDMAEYERTLRGLHQVHLRSQRTVIVPSHCERTLEEIMAREICT